MLLLLPRRWAGGWSDVGDGPKACTQPVPPAPSASLGHDDDGLGVVAFNDVENLVDRGEVGEHEADADVPSLFERTRGLGGVAAEERVEVQGGCVVRQREAIDVPGAQLCADVSQELGAEGKAHAVDPFAEVVGVLHELAPRPSEAHFEARSFAKAKMPVTQSAMRSAPVSSCNRRLPPLARIYMAAFVVADDFDHASAELAWLEAYEGRQRVLVPGHLPQARGPLGLGRLELAPEFCPRRRAVGALQENARHGRVRGAVVEAEVDWAKILVHGTSLDGGGVARPALEDLNGLGDERLDVVVAEALLERFRHEELDYSGNRTATHQPLTCWM